jgi:uncharacterized protein YuzE
MDAEMKALVAKIRTANEGWPRKRHEQGMMDVQYDADADILYVAFGEPEEAFSLPGGETEEDVYLRISLKTHKVVGMDIIHFKNAYLVKHKEAAEKFDVFFKVFGDIDWRIQTTLTAKGDHEITVFEPAGHAGLDYLRALPPKVVPDAVPV